MDVQQTDIIILAIVIAVCAGWLGWFVIDARDHIKAIRKKLEEKNG